MRRGRAHELVGTRRVFALPYVAWIAIFTIAPLILILLYAFTATGSGGVMVLTLENLERAFSPLYMTVFWRSVWMAFLATAVCLLIGYPAAYLMAKMKSNIAALVSVLFILPMWMNFLLRTYAWRALLDNAGIINQGLMAVSYTHLDVYKRQTQWWRW